MQLSGQTILESPGLSIPRRQMARSKPDRAPNQAPRVLWVGNDSHQRINQTKMLINSGFDVVATASGTAAILQYHTEPFQLVITEMALTDMTGIELLKAIKSIKADALVIITTCCTCVGDAIEALRAGALDYLVHSSHDDEQILSAVVRARCRLDVMQTTENWIEALRQKNKALEDANARLWNFAIHDSLTGLYNHRYFQDRLTCEINRSLRYSESFGILLIDLDEFKIFNDARGHLEGDELLRAIARLFLAEFRKTDTVARYGGDEFIIIMPQTSMTQGIRMGERISRLVAEQQFSGMECMPAKKITISAGYAGYPCDGITGKGLLRLADQALYWAKARGGAVVGNNGTMDSYAAG